MMFICIISNKTNGQQEKKNNEEDQFAFSIVIDLCTCNHVNALTQL